MAVDTRNKRASAVLGIRLFPNPDGSLANVFDRQFIGTIYAGIDTTGAPGSPPDGSTGLTLLLATHPART